MERDWAKGYGSMVKTQLTQLKTSESYRNDFWVESRKTNKR